MTKVVLKKLKQIDKIWHPESTLVFKSIEDKKVIGRFFNDEFISLDEIALSLCEEWNFNYDPDLVDEVEEDFVEDDLLSPVVDNTLPTTTIVDNNTRPSTTVVDNNTRPSTTVVDNNTRPSTTVVDNNTRSSTNVVDNNTLPSTTVVDNNTSSSTTVVDNNTLPTVVDNHQLNNCNFVENDFLRGVEDLVVKYKELYFDRDNYKNLYVEEVKKNKQLQKMFDELKNKFDNIKNMFS